MRTKTTPDQYRLEDIGPEHTQYFTGRSALFSGYDEVFIGYGYSAEEAFTDAVDNAHISAFEMVVNITSVLPDTLPEGDYFDALDPLLHDEEWSYVVALYVNTTPA